MSGPAAVRPRAHRESGYALLMIFLLAAIVALTLYQVMPRVAFESERDKEQLLIDRGEQYKRGIQLYYRKLQRYPVKMEDLENTNNMRFLRQRYMDPMTGKDAWRLIHVGPGGVFIDSLTQKKTTNTKKDSAPNTFITEMGGIGDTSTGLTDAINPGLRRRPSDGGGNVASDPNAPFPPDPFSQNNSNSNGVGNGLGANGLTNGGLPAGGDTGLLGQGNSLTASGSQNATNPGALPSGAPGTTSNGTNGAALIGQMLTGPRPGGPPPGIILPNSNNSGDNSAFPVASNPTNATGSGSAFGSGTSNGTAGTSGGAGQVLAGSFAGVASTAERPSIKVYGDRHKFNEWEFIYDYSKDIAKAVGLPVNGSGANGTPGQNGTGLGTPIGAGSNGTGNSTGSSFGNSSGTSSGSSGTGTSTTQAPSQ